MTYRYRFPAKTLIVSAALPPEPAGQAFVLYRWLEQVDPSSYCLLSTVQEVSSFGSDNMQPRLRAPVQRTPSLVRVWYRFGLRTIPALLIDVWKIVRILVEAIRRDRIELLIVSSGNSGDIPAGVIASRLTGIPVIFSIFDDWSQQVPASFNRKVAEWIEPTLMRQAAHTLVPNEVFADQLRARFNIPVTVVRNPADRAAFDHDTPLEPWPADPERVLMLYAGSLYGAQFDSMLRIDQALKLPELNRVALDLYLANETPEQELPFGPAIAIKPHVTGARIVALEREADILAMPLGFFSPFPKLMLTASPTKFGEYLASGRPLLVHAPANSWAAQYVKEHECGVVVDEPDSDLVAEAILEIIRNKALRETIRANAMHRAQVDFAPDISTERLMSVVQQVLRR